MSASQQMNREVKLQLLDYIKQTHRTASNKPLHHT